MRQEINNSSSGGVGFVGLLTIVFVVLKILGKIDWSWFWVLSPLIFTTALVFIFLIVYLWLIKS